MAAGDISVVINSETKAFRMGVESGIIEPLEDAEKALDELGKSRGPGDLERELEQAQRTTENLADETKKTADEIERSYRAAGKDIKKGIGDGLDDAKREAKQSGTEAAASFSGEFDDVTDFVQETVANGLGPAGIAGAALIGAIVATATAAVEDWDEKIQGIKDSTAEMWQGAAESGDQFLDSASIKAEAYRLLWDEAYKDQFAAAREAGIKQSDLALALAEGEGETYDRVHQQLVNAFRERADEASYASETYKEQGEAAMIAAGQEAQGIGAVLGVLNEKAKAVDENKRLTREAADITATAEEATRDQIARTNDAAQARYEGLAAKYSKPIKAKFQVEVDDSAVRNYRPPTVHVPWSMQSTPSGRQPV